MYGTTKFGGRIMPPGSPRAGDGTVLKVSPNGGETVLHRFCSFDLRGVLQVFLTFRDFHLL